MSYILIVLGAIIIIFGVYHFYRSISFINQSKLVEGTVIKRELTINEEQFVIHFNYENKSYEFTCTNCDERSEHVTLRVVKKGTSIDYKLNKFVVLFTDFLILMPIGLILLIGGLLLKM